MKINSAFYRFLLIIFLLKPGIGSELSVERLTLRASIESERYCDPGDGILSVLIKFDVLLVNETKTPIVIGKPIYPLVRVARTQQDLTHGNYELTLHAPSVFTRSTPAVQKSLSGPGELIQPGHSFKSSTMEVTLPTAGGKDSREIGVLAPGSYYVQLVIEGEVPGKNEFPRGTSQPVHITVAKSPRRQKCS